MANEVDNTPANTNSAPRGLRLVVRVWGAFSAICIGISGIFVLITLSAVCLGMGFLQMFAGILILPLEAPIFCAYFPTLVKLSDWVEANFKFWMRASVYLVMAFPPILSCPELSTFVGCGSVIVTAALYGVLAIGKKGAGAPSNNEDVEMRKQLVDKNGQPTSPVRTP